MNEPRTLTIDPADREFAEELWVAFLSEYARQPMFSAITVMQNALVTVALNHEVFGNDAP